MPMTIEILGSSDTPPDVTTEINRKISIVLMLASSIKYDSEILRTSFSDNFESVIPIDFE